MVKLFANNGPFCRPVDKTGLKSRKVSVYLSYMSQIDIWGLSMHKVRSMNHTSAFYNNACKIICAMRFNSKHLY